MAGRLGFDDSGRGDRHHEQFAESSQSADSTGFQLRGAAEAANGTAGACGGGRPDQCRANRRSDPMRTNCNPRSSRGSVLIIVLWVAFGLVALALYFAQSMTYELRASDNRTANMEAEQAIDGAARYVSYVLKTLGTNG